MNYSFCQILVNIGTNAHDNAMTSITLRSILSPFGQVSSIIFLDGLIPTRYLTFTIARVQSFAVLLGQILWMN